MVMMQEEQKVQQQYKKKLIKNPNNINAKYNSLKDIIEGDFFKSIQKSWSCDSVNNGKLKVCANKCGIGFDAYKEQWL